MVTYGVRSWGVGLGLVVVCATGAFSGWRSEMFPPGWQPVDERVIDGVNVLYDARGTRDLYGRAVTEGHPDYHPYRFLHDFSYAGYHRGERPVPPEDPCWVSPTVLDVTQPPYGCIPDGDPSHDCTPGIQRAIDDAGALGGAIVYLPAGEYRVLSDNDVDFLRIRDSGVVIRGAGAGRTRILVDPYRSGTFQMHRKNVIRVVGGRLWQDDVKVATRRASITRDLVLPTKVIPVASTLPFETAGPNAQVAIVGTRTDAFLVEHDMVGTWSPSRPAYLFRRTVVAIDPAAKTITVDVPTRYRIRTTDLPEVSVVPGGISEVGLEGLSIGMIRHPDEWAYEGDIVAARDAKDPPVVYDLWQARAISLLNVEHGWVYDVASYRPAENAGRPVENIMTDGRYAGYDVEILNEAILIEQCRHITVKNVRFQNAQVDYGSSNGYAIRVSGSDNLLDRVTIVRMKKGFALMNSWAHGNVVRDCGTTDPLSASDIFHWELSMANLVENHVLDGGYWAAVIQGMDDVAQGHSASETVFWNTRGLREPDTGIKTILDRDNDEDGLPDLREAHGDLPDIALVISNQFGWGYVIGTYGVFSEVLTASMQRAVDGDWSRPHMYPRDFREGIGYDPSTDGDLEPRSLYSAQLSLRRQKLGLPVSPVDDASLVDLILDNGEEGTSSTGAWSVSGGADPYGASSLYTWEDGASYRYRFELPQPGRYEVLAWWTEWPSRPAAVPVEIGRLGGSSWVSIDQREPGGRWVPLGSWDFGDAATVTVHSLGKGSTCADAVRVRSSPITPVPSCGSAGYVLDNGDVGTLAAGGWWTSGGEDPFGETSLYSKDVGATYTYRFDGIEPGGYRVHLWWTTWPSRVPNVPVEVVHSEGTAHLEIDQQEPGGEWVPVGVWSFGSSAEVTIVSLGTGSTCADAVRLEPADVVDPELPPPEPPPPAVVIDNGQAGTSKTGWWSVSGGLDPCGESSLYSKDPGATYSYGLSGLVPGDYRVFLWWTTWPSRATRVPVDVVHSKGTARLEINQTEPGGAWVPVGVWSFGASATVTIHSLGVGSTCADAVKLEPAGR